MNRPHRPILSDSEAYKLALALAEGSGDDGFTESDVEDLFTFAEETRVAGQLLKGVLDGRFLVRRGDDGEFEFKTARGGMTDLPRLR